MFSILHQYSTCAYPPSCLGGVFLDFVSAPRWCTRFRYLISLAALACSTFLDPRRMRSFAMSSSSTSLIPQLTSYDANEGLRENVSGCIGLDVNGSALRERTPSVWCPFCWESCFVDKSPKTGRHSKFVVQCGSKYPVPCESKYPPVYLVETSDFESAGFHFHLASPCRCQLFKRLSPIVPSQVKSLLRAICVLLDGSVEKTNYRCTQGNWHMKATWGKVCWLGSLPPASRFFFVYPRFRASKSK